MPYVLNAMIRWCIISFACNAWLFLQGLIIGYTTTTVVSVSITVLVILNICRSYYDHVMFIIVAIVLVATIST